MHSPPLFAGASLKRASGSNGVRRKGHSPPLFAGASLKPAHAVSGELVHPHSLPLFAGASLKQGRGGRRGVRERIPPRFLRGPH